MQKIDIHNILVITRETITYRDDRGGISSMELDDCANNWEKQYKRGQNPKAGLRCIGERFWGEYAYYELYTIEHTQLYLNLPSNRIKRIISKLFNINLYRKEFALFYSVQKKLNQNGWTTLDLS